MKAITTRVSLDFLGEDYKDSYLVLKSITMREYDTLQAEAKKLEGDNTKSTAYIISEISERFISGKILGEDIVKDDLLDLPPNVFINAYSSLIGADASPKV